MNIAIWFLIICFIVMALLIGSILFYEPQKHTVYNMNNHNNEVISNVLNIMNRNLVHNLYIQWPELDVMLEKDNSDNVLFLKWKGLVKEEKIILFYFPKYDDLHALLEAVARLNENNDTPFYRFVVAIENRHVQNVSKEISLYLHSLNKPIVGVYTSGEGIQKRDKKDFLYVSSGLKGKLILSSESRNFKNWAKSIHYEPIFADNDVLEEYYDLFENELSFIMKLQYIFYKKKFLNNFIIQFPELKYQFLPKFTVIYNQLIVEVNNEKEKEDVLSFLQEESSLNSISLKVIDETYSVPFSQYSELDDKILKSLENELKFCQMVRISSVDDIFTLIPGVSTRGISIDNEDMRLKGETQVNFYLNLLK